MLLDGHFTHERRFIWHYAIPVEEEKLKIFVFLDDSLRCEERKDYLSRVHNEYEGYSQENFYKAQLRFGTLSLAVPINSEITAQEAYRGYVCKWKMSLICLKTCSRPIELILVLWPDVNRGCFSITSQ